jgi:hypothetical protein
MTWRAPYINPYIKGRLESAESHKASMESALEDARAGAARAEDRVSASAGEIRKGNQIIERLQAELRSAKAKAKLKAAGRIQNIALAHHVIDTHSFTLVS